MGEIKTLLEQGKFKEAREAFLGLSENQQEDFLREISIPLFPAPIMGVLFRKLHPGQTYDDFKKAWLPPLKGGRGGLGNDYFKTSTNRAPRKATPGEPFEELWVWLRLKLIADVGLVGLPNAGKSTFLSVVSRAKPKIADYPFTTTIPQLGVVRMGHDREFVIADLPGLIEGAHEGVGLGDRFLGHVERCKAILHLVDATQEDVVGAYQTIRHELKSYGHNLDQKKEVLALSKCDSLMDEEALEKKAELERASGNTVMLLSSSSNKGVREVQEALWKIIDTKSLED